MTTIVLRSIDVADELSAAGTIEAVDKAQLGFMVPGRLLKFEVEDGASVSTGQLLARLDDADYRQEVAIAEARLAEIRARAERLRKMHELGSLTATDYEKITAGLTEAESAATLARQRLAYTELRAPFAGRVTRHSVAAGTVVAPGSPICSVLAPAPVWATLSVPEATAAQLLPGQVARVRLAAAETVEATAPIETVLPQADPITRSFQVKVRLANDDLAFRPGNVVVASVELGSRRSVVTLPPAAVQRFPDGALYVWVVEPQRSTVTRRIVTIGRPRGVALEVTSGLESGERVVTASATPLFDGMPVSASAAQP
ncbi:MAG: efflux RND transporter periplasmic adaptor subunit [Opitutus sp.]|nr:efflux RND transporter periplasmic adaptor subunit [Opitutus sp.]